jgi:hypothetical protein
MTGRVILWRILPSCSGLSAICASFFLGHSLYSVFLFAMFGFGIGLNLLNEGVLLFLLTAASFLFAGIKGLRDIFVPAAPSPPQNTETGHRVYRRTIFTALLFLFFVLALGLFALSLFMPVSDLAEVAIWCYKAKILAVETESFFRILSDGERLFAQGSYPPGFSFFLLPFFQICGEQSDVIVKIIPPITGLFCVLMVYDVLRLNSGSRGMGLFLTLTYAASFGFIMCCVRVYGDMFCIALAIFGIHILFEIAGENNSVPCGKLKNFKMIFASCLFLSASAWFKNEGLLYLLSALTIFAVLNRGKNRYYECMISLAIPALIFILPWLAVKMLGGLELRDFLIRSAVLSGNLGEYQLIAKYFMRVLFSDIMYSNGIWILFFVMALANWKQAAVRSELKFILLLIAFLLCFYFVLFFFSVRPLEWHLRSACPRIILVPMFLALLFIARTSSPPR